MQVSRLDVIPLQWLLYICSAYQSPKHLFTSPYGLKALLQAKQIKHVNYTLPDGGTITIASERFQCPEALFNPSLLGSGPFGIHEAVYNAVIKCDEEFRRKLFANIVRAGGNTSFSGLATRLWKEIATLSNRTFKTNVISSPQPQYSA